MKDFLETPLGKMLLLAVVLSIWGVNVRTFSELSGEPEAQSVQQVHTVDINALTIPNKAKYSYRAAGRDPFKSVRQQREATGRTASQQVQDEPEEDPLLTLTGIFDGMAVITDASGSTFFVKEGETFKPDLILKRVVEDFVIVEYKQRNIILKLNDE